MVMDKMLVILGPTATGKTDLAIKLAKKYNGELVACDSRQVYKGLDIGTGKMPGSGKWEVRRGIMKWEVGGARIWMYDVVSPKKQYTVADYVKDADKVIRGIGRRDKLPIIVGGTGLYLKALVEGLPNLSIPVDKKLREKLEKLSLAKLQEKLKSLSPTRWKNLNQSDRQNPRRLLRSIEIASMNGYAVNGWGFWGIQGEFNVLKIGLTAPREVLYERVDLRVLSRITQGMVDEAKKLQENGLSPKRMRELGLEYGVLADYLDGKIRKIEGDMGLVRIMQNRIHGYVRRQLTWFKEEKDLPAGRQDINWVDITDKNYYDKVDNLVAKWYY